MQQSNEPLFSSSVVPLSEDTESVPSTESEQSSSQENSEELLSREGFRHAIRKKLNSREGQRVHHALLMKIERNHHMTSLPPPDVIERYNKVIPGGAERIMELLETQTHHRLEFEKTQQQQDFAKTLRGQNFGFLIGMGTIICGTLCILAGHEIAGLLLGGTGLTSLVSVFVYGHLKQHKDSKIGKGG